MKRIIIICIVSLFTFSCEEAKKKTSEDCIKEIVSALQVKFEKGNREYPDVYKPLEKDLKDFVKSIKPDAIISSADKTFSKKYFLHKNWDLETIEKDKCEDEISIVFDIENKSFQIQVNSCSIFEEDGDTHIAEGSLMFEYIFDTNCSYRFYGIIAAG
ncbi:hypothetical protein [Kordia sp.]|uniref:hypothetical protein n=1 Tax=Kordia sp. TaxID=1965332 RepID=UPI003D6B52C7